MSLATVTKGATETTFGKKQVAAPTLKQFPAALSPTFAAAAIVARLKVSILTEQTAD